MNYTESFDAFFVALPLWYETKNRRRLYSLVGGQ